MNQINWLDGCSKECYGFRGPPFPQKLYSAMETPRAVIQWSDNGRAICVDAEDYELNVMHVHPGLVEISSFANFRRQMREYGFDWLYHPETREFEFSHPSFLRGRPELLSAVLTRRKRRRKHGVNASVGSRLQSSSLLRRRSVIHYTGVPRREGQNTKSASLQTRDVGAAKSLDKITDEEWWTYCVPAIMVGMNEVNNDGLSGQRYPTIEHRLTTPLCFYYDDPNEDFHRHTTVSKLSDGLWTRRVLDFDEL